MGVEEGGGSTRLGVKSHFVLPLTVRVWAVLYTTGESVKAGVVSEGGRSSHIYFLKKGFFFRIA